MDYVINIVVKRCNVTMCFETYSPLTFLTSILYCVHKPSEAYIEIIWIWLQGASLSPKNATSTDRFEVHALCITIG